MDCYGGPQRMAPGFEGSAAAAARWPKAEKKSSSQDSLHQRAPPVEFAPTPASSGGRTGRWRAGQEQRASPDAVRQEARERVVKLQRALEVLEETSGPEVDGLRSALEKAGKLSSEPARGGPDHRMQGFHCAGREASGRVGRSASPRGCGLGGRKSQVATSRGRSGVQGSGWGTIHSGTRGSSGSGSRGGAVAREGDRVAGSESGTPGVFQTASHWHNPHVPTGPSFAGGFRPDVQRRHHEVDGRPASRYPRGHHGRQRSRGGKALSCHGVRGHRMVNTEHVAVDGDQFSALNMDSEASRPEWRLVLLRILGCGVGEAENPGPGQFIRQRGDASCSFCVARDARYGLRGMRIGEAAHPGPGRDSRRRRRVISSDDEVGSDDAPLVPPTVVDDVECTQWESGASFSPPSRSLEFFSTRTPVSVSNHFTALGICSTESDTESVACELRIRRRRLSLVWDADSVSYPANKRGEVVPPRREVGSSAPVDAERGSQRSTRGVDCDIG